MTIVRQVLKPLPSACFAALGYGCWAFWAQDAGVSVAAFRAALVQSGFAFASTLLLGQIARYLYLQFNSKLVVFAVCSLLLCLTPFTLHFVNQSQQIFLAMLPGLIVGHVYLSSLIWFDIGVDKQTQHKLTTSSENG